MAPRRKYMSMQDREALLALQDAKCDDCGDAVALGRAEADHKQSLAEGGSNGLENFHLVCRQCHARRSDAQALRGGTTQSSLQSHLSPQLGELFGNHVKPKQLRRRRKGRAGL